MPFFTTVTPNDPLYVRIVHTRTDAFRFWHQSQNKDGTPYDYNGHTFTCEIKKFKGDSVQQVVIPNDSFELSQSDAGVAAGVKDIFEFTHPPADFADLIASPFEYYIDIQITDAEGNPFTPIIGDFIIRAD